MIYYELWRKKYGCWSYSRSNLYAYFSNYIGKDLENKRIMENPIQLPAEQQEQLTQIRDSTAEVMSNVGYLHSEINERLARLEAQTELKKLEKMLKEIEEKEKKLNKK